MTYQEQIKAIEDYMDASLGVNGEITRKAEEAVNEMKTLPYDQIKWERDTAIGQLKDLGYGFGEKTSDVPDTNVGKIIPNDVNFWCERAKHYESVCGQLMADIAKGVTLDSMSINENGITFTKSKEPTPGALEKQVSILADALNGCPLTDPCDRLWAPHGWCEEHCGEGQQEPSKECWLKYAEVMASE